MGRVGVAGDQRRQVARLGALRRDRSPFRDVVPGTAARDAIWVQPRLVGRVEFTGWVAGGRLRLPRWRGLVDPRTRPAEVDPARWARPPEPPPSRTPATAATAVAVPASDPAPTPEADPLPGPATSRPDAPPEQARRLEQHFVYNALNTIAALIRTDPGRARELLFGFADLSRAADQPGDAPSTLGQELAAVRAYLKLEQARFGKRLRVRLELDPALDVVPVRPRLVLDAVRAAVQQGIEPHPQGGELLLRTCAAARAEIKIAVDTAEPVTVTLPLDVAAVPG